jgi:hypothetical protein
MISYGCGKGCGVDMVYIGDGDWECPKCGKVTHFGEPNEDDESERLSVWDAAEIWVSNGRDEDYMFGYTEDELENAL